MSAKDSQVVTLVASLAARLRAAWRTSTVRRLLGPDSGGDDGGSSAGLVQESRVGDALQRGRTLVRGSALYQWLTADPEPEVIVIDLRETRTVGPVLAVLDRLVTWLTPSWRSSSLREVLEEVDRLADYAAETRVGSLLAAALAPPEPPDANSPDTDDDATADTDETDGAASRSDR